MIKEFAVPVAGRSQGAPASFTLESAFGSVEPAGSPTDFDALICAAKDDKALRTTCFPRGTLPQGGIPADLADQWETALEREGLAVEPAPTSDA